ncbi:MAG: cyclic nucleotide-binding domain-containing protein [Bryobacteraceae bacterium]
MKVHDLSGPLSDHPFLAGLKAEHLTLIAGCSSNRVYGPGEYLAREGAEAEEFYVIRDGQVALETFAPQTGARRVLTLHPGDVAGLSWLVEPYLWKLDMRAVTPVRVIAIDGKCLRGKCEQDPELGYRLFQRVARLMEDRLHATRLQLLDLYGKEGAAELAAGR